MEGYSQNGNGEVAHTGSSACLTSRHHWPKQRCNAVLFSWIFKILTKWMSKARAIRNDCVHMVMNLMSTYMVHQRKYKGNVNIQMYVALLSVHLYMTIILIEKKTYLQDFHVKLFQMRLLNQYFNCLTKSWLKYTNQIVQIFIQIHSSVVWLTVCKYNSYTVIYIVSVTAGSLCLFFGFCMCLKIVSILIRVTILF